MLGHSINACLSAFPGVWFLHPVQIRDWCPGTCSGSGSLSVWRALKSRRDLLGLGFSDYR